MRLIGVWAAAVVLCLALVLVPSRYGVVDAIQLDIHIKLDDATNDLVMKLGREITRLAPHNQVDFDTLAEPHVTLYLADFPFAHILDLIETVKQAAPLFHRCPVTLNNTVVSGTYMLWNADVTPCLQNLSDTAVMAAYKLRNVSAPVPEWVLKLPDPPRSEMIRLFQQYGSPGVFAFFQPHVTLAYDTVDDLHSVLAAIKIPQGIKFEAKEGAMGPVGVGGTVLRGHQLLAFPLR